MTDNYLPLAYLNAWEFCPRRFYFEYVLGEMADNEHIIRGRHLHRNIDEEGEFWEGETLIRRQQWVWSDRLQVKGVIDAVAWIFMANQIRNQRRLLFCRKK